MCADLLPSRKRRCVAAYERARLAGAGAAPSGVDEPEMGGVAGILLPADVSIHSVVSTGSSGLEWKCWGGVVDVEPLGGG